MALHSSLSVTSWESFFFSSFYSIFICLILNQLYRETFNIKSNQYMVFCCCCRCKRGCFPIIIPILSLIILVSSAFSLYLVTTWLINSPLSKAYRTLTDKGNWMYIALIISALGAMAIVLSSIGLSLLSCFSTRYYLKGKGTLCFKFLVLPTSLVLAITAFITGGSLLGLAYL